jgi:hypothetical protein
MVQKPERDCRRSECMAENCTGRDNTLNFNSYFVAWDKE